MLRQMSAQVKLQRASIAKELRVPAARASGLASICSDPVDEEIDDFLGRVRDIGVSDAPTRKVAIDVHARKAVDQRAAGDLRFLQVGRAELTRRKRLRKRAFGQIDQLGIVARYVRRL